MDTPLIDKVSPDVALETFGSSRTNDLVTVTTVSYGYDEAGQGEDGEEEEAQGEGDTNGQGRGGQKGIRQTGSGRVNNKHVGDSSAPSSKLSKSSLKMIEKWKGGKSSKGGKGVHGRRPGVAGDDHKAGKKKAYSSATKSSGNKRGLTGKKNKRVR